VLQEDSEVCFVVRTQGGDYPAFLQALAEHLEQVVGLAFVQVLEPETSSFSSFCVVAGAAKGQSGVEACLEARQVDGILKNRPADGQGRHSMEGI